MRTAIRLHSNASRRYAIDVNDRSHLDGACGPEYLAPVSGKE